MLPTDRRAVRTKTLGRECFLFQCHGKLETQRKTDKLALELNLYSVKEINTL